MRFISHLDVVRAWERAIRRAEIPVLFSQGFSPRPRMHFGPALPTCFASSAEFLDLSLHDTVVESDLEPMGAALSGCLPEGMEVVACAAVDERGPALMEAIVAAEYLVTLRGDPDDLDAALAGLVARESIPFEIVRKGRARIVDLREGIIDIRRVDPEGELPTRVGAAHLPRDPGQGVLWCRVATKPRSLRPTELLSVLGDRFREHVVHRSAQLLTASEPDTHTDTSAGLVEPLALQRELTSITNRGLHER